MRDRLLLGALRAALAEAGHRGASTTARGMLGAFRPEAPATAVRPQVIVRQGFANGLARGLVGQDALVQRVREVALAPLEHDRERPRIASG